MNPAEYLRLPYSWCFIPSYEDGEFSGYTSYILEFPGCISEGENLFIAEENLFRAAYGWIRAALDLGQEIPEPAARLYAPKYNPRHPLGGVRNTRGGIWMVEMSRFDLIVICLLYCILGYIIGKNW